MEREISKKNDAIAKITSDLENTQKEFNTKFEAHMTVDQVHRKEELINEETRQKIKAVEQEEGSKNINLRHQNAELKLAMAEKVQEIVLFAKFSLSSKRHTKS